MRTDGLVGKFWELVFGGSSISEAPNNVKPVLELVDLATSSSSKPVVAGCVQVLGLDAIYPKGGMSRGDMARGVKAITEEVLKEQLGKADRYRALNEHTFQICFATTDESRARKQADDVRAAIDKKIANEPLVADRGLVADCFVAQVESNSLNDGDDLFSALYARLLDIRKAAEAASTLQQSLSRAPMRVAFQPLWPRSELEPALNRPVVGRAFGEEIVRQLEQSEDLNQAIEVLTALDWQVFTKCVEGLHAALQEHRKSDVIIPIQFRTLATPSSKSAQLLRTLPAQYKPFILVEITGVPGKADSSQLLDAVEATQTFGFQSILNLSPFDHRLNDEITTRLWGLSTSVAESSDERELSCFALSAAELGLRSVAYGASSISKAETAVTAGFDYIGGSAVHCTVPIPRPQARFTPLFGDQDPPETRRRHRPSLRSHSRFRPADSRSIITLCSGKQHTCRIINVSISGALVLSHAPVALGEYLAIGSISARVVRCFTGGFALQFLEIQCLSGLEEALGVTVFDFKELQALQEYGLPDSCVRLPKNGKNGFFGSSIRDGSTSPIGAATGDTALSAKALMLSPNVCWPES